MGKRSIHWCLPYGVSTLNTVVPSQHTSAIPPTSQSSETFFSPRWLQTPWALRSPFKKSLPSGLRTACSSPWNSLLPDIGIFNCLTLFKALLTYHLLVKIGFTKFEFYPAYYKDLFSLLNYYFGGGTIHLTYNKIYTCYFCCLLSFSH